MNEYPDNWPDIALSIKIANDWKCERCKHENDFPSGHVLTVHHLDGNKANCEDWNLAALCQRCHLRIQGRVKMEQGFFEAVMPVSDWFKPHLAGYLASIAQRPAQNPIPEPAPKQLCRACATPSGTPDRPNDAPPEPACTPPVPPA